MPEDTSNYRLRFGRPDSDFTRNDIKNDIIQFTGQQRCYGFGLVVEREIHDQRAGCQSGRQFFFLPVMPKKR